MKIEQRTTTTQEGKTVADDDRKTHETEQAQFRRGRQRQTMTRLLPNIADLLATTVVANPCTSSLALLLLLLMATCNSYTVCPRPETFPNTPKLQIQVDKQGIGQR